MSELITKTTNFVKSNLTGLESGHDWHHTERVWKMAKHLREMEGSGDLLVIELASLLHDIADPKFNDGDTEKGGQIAFNFLVREGVDPEKAEHVQSIIKNISYKGGHDAGRIDTVEFRIVQDADRLDAMGAIGIARAFNYGGYRNRPLHDPDTQPVDYQSASAYYQSPAPTINHFYEKLLRLKDLINTESARKIANERHRYMEEYLDRFLREWEGG